MDLQLKGRRAIVTGSSAGIGEAIALGLEAEGAAVIVHSGHTEPIGQQASGGAAYLLTGP